MSAINDATPVATVGSPSTNSQVILNISGDAAHTPLVGAMLFLTDTTARPGDSAGRELALGVVTEVTTTNKNVENPDLRAAGSVLPQLAEQFTGDGSDSRIARINLQACYRQAAGEIGWRQGGSSLSTSPTTGVKVAEVTDDVLTEILADPDVHYLGYMASAATRGRYIKLPLKIRDFEGERGAFHTVICGLTGAGKALAVDTPIPTPTGWTLMGDLRDGDIVFDENGQPCTVVKAHDVLHGRECFEVEFSDGSVIVADGEHLWYSETNDVRVRASHYRGLDATAQRARLLAPDVVARLRNMAEESDETSLITQRELAQLAGLDRNSSAVTTVLRSVGTATVISVPVQRRTPSSITRSRTLSVYPARDALLALAAICVENGSSAPVYNDRMAERLYGLSEALTDADTATMPDIARMCGVPARNTHLKRLLTRTGVQTVRASVTLSYPVKSGVHEIAREVTAYPRKAALLALAAHGEKPLSDQRHKRTNVTGSVVTTKEMRDSLRTSSGRINHAVPVAGALNTPDADLLIDPYAFGVWLGDGRKNSFAITSDDPEIIQRLTTLGYVVTSTYDITYRMALAPTPGKCLGCGAAIPGKRRWHAECRSLATLTGRLDLLGVRHNKHIPAEYLRASESQRRALLAGLLDTDGTVAQSGQLQFDNTNKRLIDDVYELVVSLGYRATVNRKDAVLDGRVIGDVWRIAFTTGDDLFGLTRKANAQQDRSRHVPAYTSHRYVVDVRPVDSVPVRCITVDSASHLYLAGKSMVPTHNTAITNYLLAGQMRFPDHGMIVIDPQGQWSHEQGLPFSLQGWAAEMGRDVIVARISEDLRLDKDSTLFATLLGKTKFTSQLMRMGQENAEILLDELAKVVKKRDDWDTEDSDSLLRHIAGELQNTAVLNRIYATQDKQDRLASALAELVNDADRFREVLLYFKPLHNLFQTTNPAGNPRKSMWATVSAVFDKSARAGRPAPLLILDMSTGDVSWIAGLLNDEEQQEAADALAILDQDSIKAAILRQTCATLKRASESSFRAGENLNTQVILDEAWRYAPPPGNAMDREVEELSRELAGYARDTRKFGIGWTYITQSPRSLNSDIWDQVLVRILGYGLAGPDLDKVAEQLDDRDALRLYRTFPPPDATHPRVYPFMLTGPVSPLAFTKTPLFLAAYTDFDLFRADNAHWIGQIRSSLGMPVLSGTPTRPGAAPARVRRSGSVVSKTERTKNAEKVRANRENGGVDPASRTGLVTDPTMGTSLDTLDAMTDQRGPNGRPIDPVTGEEFDF